MKALLQQIGKFLFVGGLSTGIHFFSALVLHHGFDVAPLRANFVAFCLATTWSCCGNWFWTFNRQAAFTYAVPRLLLLACTGFAINQAIVFVMLEAFSLPFWFALFVATGLVAAFTFWVSKTKIFGTRSVAA